MANQQLVGDRQGALHEPQDHHHGRTDGSLTDSETEQLFAIIRQLKARHVAVVYISHRLDELRQICDR